MHVRCIGLSTESDARREQALLDILKAMPTAGNVVSACMFHLKGLSREALRAGIQRVLNQPDGFDTDCAKVAALIRLIPIDAPTAEDALLIACYAHHPRSELRNVAQREVKGLMGAKRAALLEANCGNSGEVGSRAEALQLFLRALGAL
jgi:hypothetical protein